MCAIAGIFAYGNTAPPVDQAELLRIRERMVNRGPDGAGLWIDGDRRIGLAHRRLSIIDTTDAGAQPMLDPDTGNRIVFNGEIDNDQALRDELQAVGARFRSHSDTEVLLKLYAAQGPELLHRLRGMFAFAIWNARQQGLFIARDPFGIKPLYLADDGQTLRLASQVKALLAGGRVDTAPEPAGHVGFFLWGHVPEPYSLYKGIRALPAGTSLWIDCAGHRTQRTFFNLTNALAQTQPASQALTPQAAREQLHAALLDSVRHHLIADVPVGVFLSAGLDSTTLAALAREAGVAELRTVTLGFREFAGTENDETPLAEAVARQYGATHHTQWVRRQDFADRFDHLLDAMDQTTIDGVNSYEVLNAERVRHGWRERATGAWLCQTIQGLDAPRLKITALETTGYRRNQRLRDSDWASMANSLEVRVPLVDLELTRLVARLIHARANRTWPSRPPRPCRCPYTSGKRPVSPSQYPRCRQHRRAARLQAQRRLVRPLGRPQRSPTPATSCGVTKAGGKDNRG